jgi:type VII secretion-associated serine protease mycosin
MAFRRAAAVTAVLVASVVAAPVAAWAAEVCASPPPAGTVSTALPWEEQFYDFARIAPVADGTGVRVAVIDSGVDADQPQLRGHVERGRDFLRRSSAGGAQDCIGHGTGVASIIAARPLRTGVPFRGLAPGVTIVPIRVTERKDTADGGTNGEAGGPKDFADAIDWAADPARGNADVINMSLSLDSDPDGLVKAAVARALARRVVIVAAAGNHGKPTEANPAPYPASYDGVIGVGAIGRDGLRADFSQHGAYVDVMAVGDGGITMAAPHRGHVSTENGTSFATPFVTATVALILQRFRSQRLSPAQILDRLVATADPAPGGQHSAEYGYGLLNPYRALTETLGPATPRAPVPAATRSEDPAVVALRDRRGHSQDLALAVAGAGAGAVALVGLLTGAIRRGRRRNWRPGT